MLESVPPLMSVLAFLAVLIGFGLLVFLHELGHFLVAKWVGICVTQFAVGFGPCIVSWRRGLGFRFGSSEDEREERLAQEGADAHALGETEYRLNWVPFGGYVKMLGQEDLDPTAASADPRSFTQKLPWERAAVLSAGVVMNVLVGAVLYVAAFTLGVPFPPAEVGEVRATAPAAQAHAVGHEGEARYRGLRAGDRITHLDGEPVSDFSALARGVALSGGDPVTLRVRRNGETLRYRIRPHRGGQRDLLSIGVGPPRDRALRMVLEESPLHQAGVKPGWRLVRVNGEPVDGFAGYHRAATTTRGASLQLTFADPKGETRKRVEVSPRTGLRWSEQEPRPALLGLVPPTHATAVLGSSAADEAGVEPGDVIVRLGEATWPTMGRIQDLVAGAQGPMKLEVLRDGEKRDLGNVAPGFSGKIGIAMEPAREPLRAGRVRADSPFASLQLPRGSRITEIGGTSVESYSDLHRVLADKLKPAELPLQIEVGYRLRVADQPAGGGTVVVDEAAAERFRRAGWEPPVAAKQFQVLKEPVRAGGPLEALAMGAMKTGETMHRVYLTLRRLLEGSVQIKHMQGPVGITDTGMKVAQRGLAYLLFFFGLISVNLAVINFLPIPVVDGGHLVFVLIEKIKGSPVGPRVQQAALMAGLALIVSVFLTVTFYDLLRVFGFQ